MSGERPTEAEVYAEAVIAARDADRPDLLARIFDHLADELLAATSPFVRRPE